jgi:hypothetical protein
VKTWIAVAATLALVACSSDKGPVEPGGVTSIGVVAVTSSMVVGGTQQLTASARDAAGKPVPSATFAWSSNAAAVATVSSAGLVTAVSPGTAVISARVGSVSESFTLQVNENPCTKPVALNVGEVRQFSGGAVVSCIALAPTSGVSEYLIIGTNTRPAQDDQLPFSMTSTTSTALAALSLPDAALIDPRQIVQRQEEDRIFDLHERLRAYERRVVEPILPTVAARAAASRTLPAGQSAQLALQLAALGDTVTIRVPNLNTGKDICKDNIPIRAVVRAISSKATIIEDVNAPSLGFTPADFTAIGAEFDNVIFPTDTLWFGKPTDQNADGRITILYTPEVNKLTPAGSSGFTAGFFFGSDLLKKADFGATNECRNQTNEQEIFYVLAADPAGQFNNVRTSATVRQGTRGVIAHEFQHMINQGVRQFNPAVQDLETFWLNEAMSHLAEEVVGRAIRGFGDFQRLSFTNVNPNPANTDDYQAFFRQNLARFQRWMARPDTSAPVSTQNRNQLAPRGASWALLRYTIDQYSGGSAKAFTRALALGPQTDVPNLLARAKGAQFDQIIAGWLVANYADGLNVSGLPARYSYLSWNIRDVMTQSSGGFPLLVDQFPGTFNTQVMSSSGTYFRLVRNGASLQAQVKMLSPSGAALASDYPTVIVLRVN